MRIILVALAALAALLIGAAFAGITRVAPNEVLLLAARPELDADLMIGDPLPPGIYWISPRYAKFRLRAEAPLPDFDAFMALARGNYAARADYDWQRAREEALAEGHIREVAEATLTTLAATLPDVPHPDRCKAIRIEVYTPQRNLTGEGNEAAYYKDCVLHFNKSALSDVLARRASTPEEVVVHETVHAALGAIALPYLTDTLDQESLTETLTGHVLATWARSNTFPWAEAAYRIWLFQLGRQDAFYWSRCEPYAFPLNYKAANYGSALWLQREYEGPAYATFDLPHLRLGKHLDERLTWWIVRHIMLLRRDGITIDPWGAVKRAGLESNSLVIRLARAFLGAGYAHTRWVLLAGYRQRYDAADLTEWSDVRRSNLAERWADNNVEICSATWRYFVAPLAYAWSGETIAFGRAYANDRLSLLIALAGYAPGEMVSVRQQDLALDPAPVTRGAGGVIEIGAHTSAEFAGMYRSELAQRALAVLAALMACAAVAWRM